MTAAQSAVEGLGKTTAGIAIFDASFNFTNGGFSGGKEERNAKRIWG
jgi:hypothetical protein